MKIDASTRTGMLSNMFSQFTKRLSNFSLEGVDDGRKRLEADIRSIVRELDVTAFHVLRSCHLFNSVEARMVTRSLVDESLYPERPKIFAAAVRGELQLYLDNESVRAFFDLYDSAALATELARSAILTSGSIKSISSLAKAAAAWRATAVHAVEAIRQGEVLLQNTGVEYVVSERERIVALLLQAAEGGTAGVDARLATLGGRAVDERRYPRYQKSLPVTLTVCGRSMPAILRDIARGGCGVEATNRLSKAVHIRVAMTNLLNLDGEVIWVSGLRAGIKFDQLLNEAELMRARGMSAERSRRS